MSFSCCSVNESLKMSVQYIGYEKTPIILIDDFLLSPDRYLSSVLGMANFTRCGRGIYPGLRSSLPDDYIQLVSEHIWPLIFDTYYRGMKKDEEGRAGYFSILSTKSKDLSLLQSIPHFDTSRKNQFAILQYLSRGNFDGTCFFRHKQTGFERIYDSRVSEYIESCKLHWNEYGLPESGYIGDSTSQFEAVSRVQYFYNRLLIYPVNLLHSALVSDDRRLSSSYLSGRLTANIFVDFGG